MLISVITPVYNNESFIGDSIRSVQHQTHTDWEMIVVDDGSTDDSAAVVEAFQRKDSRIRLLRQPNRGSAAARNRAIAEAKGTYYALLDADDLMLPDRLAEQLAFLENTPAVSVVSCLARYINADNQEIGSNYSDIYTVEDCQRYLREGKIIFCLQSGVMLRPAALAAVGGYREELLLGQDTELWNRLAEAGYYLVVLPRILVRYRLHGSSAMTRFQRYTFYTDWIIDNIQRRRRGQPERSKEAFTHYLAQQSWWFRVNRMRSHYAQFFYRTAGLMYGSRRYGRFVLNILGAAVLKPPYVLRKLYLQRLAKSPAS